MLRFVPLRVKVPEYGGDAMDCKEANKRMSGFLNDELSSRELKDFLGHISCCKDCKEELSIQFLVQEGMARLEDGSTFDLKSELDKLLTDVERKMVFYQWLRYLVYGVEILAIITIVVIIVMVLVL